MQAESLDGIHANESRRGCAVNRSFPSVKSNPRFRGVRDLVVCAGGLLCWNEAAWGQSGANNQLTNLSLDEAFFGVVVLGIVANAYLVGLFHPVSPGTGGICRRWARKWELSPQDLGAFSWWRLALWSLLSLFFELLMIRWISSEIRVFAYFKNFVLIACFLGFGLGCYLCRRRVNLLLIVVPLLTFTLIIKLPWDSLRVFISAIPAYVGASSQVHVWGVPSEFSFPLLAAALAVIVPFFGLICFIFIPFGQLVGWYLENSGIGITAYSVNVIASLAGIILYTLLCFLYQPPITWFLVTGLILAGLLWRVPTLRWWVAIALVLCLGLLSISPGKDRRTYWSPYQKLTLIRREISGEPVAYELSTNDSWYQQILDLSPEFVKAHPELFESVPIEWNAYNIPYHFFPQPPSVLVLGSGMGNDVAAAVRNGAKHVTAVEIDPLILALGRKLHPENPYSSPLVCTVQDDARSYLQKSSDRFDLIVFSLLDSHTTSSHFSNIRIDNYVYTLEALQAAKKLLKPDGIFIIKFQVETPWIAGRLHGLLQSAFGHAPLQLEADSSYIAYTSGGRFFISGSEHRIQQALSDRRLAAYVAKHNDFQMSSASLTTDDWPYFYQHEPGLPASVIIISVALVILCWMLLRDTGAEVRSTRWHFFFLGAGFLLLEAQIISKMALLFGTTWIVNSIVISGLLLLIVAANFLVQFVPRFPVGIAYVGIFLALFVSYAVPLEKLFFASMWAKVLMATIVLCLPVFFAGIIFVRSFAREGFRGEALGSNLMGSMVGGILESASLWTGIRFLLVLAALLYLASWIALAVEKPARPRREKTSEDVSPERELATAP
jgi:spermidine synthase